MAMAGPAEQTEVVQGGSPETASQRHALPVTRQSVTHKFQIMGHEGYLTIGLFDDGRPGEIFVKMSKEGSTLSGMVQAFTRAFSLALQYGLPLDEAVKRFKGMRFEPMGLTSNPDIPEALSIIDYVARFLEIHFCKATARA
ncbi:MAG: hypothetical protein CMJ18_11260 [Phycisphaeraceae bacterium]|nr:hypothetical protein [Phycisphaeraceae bacterium]